MSVSAGNREIFYDADGVETEFDFTFDVTDSDDVSVSVVADGVESVVDPGDYTIALTARDETEAYYPGGTVTFDTAPADGGRVRIYGDADIENNMNLTANESVFRSSLQRFVDRAYWVAQELKRDLARKFGFQDPEESAFEFPASDEAGYWYSDGAGNISLVETVDSGDLTVGGDTAGYVPFWSAAMTLTGVVNFFYTLATKTLRLRGSTTASDHTLKLQDSAGTDVGTFRSDGVATASTDLVTKATTDAIANAALPKAGGTMTGDLVLAGNPDAALKAAPKQYVDGAKASGTRKACRVYQTASQTVTAVSTEDITWDAESFDTDGMHSTSSDTDRIVIVTPGLYMFNAVINWTNPGAGAYTMKIKKNGASIAEMEKSINGTSDETLQLTVLSVAVATDYYEVEVTNLTLGSESVRGGSEQSYFEAVLLDQ